MMRTRFARKGGGPGVACGIQQVCGRAIASQRHPGANSNNHEDRARRAYEASDFASALELYQDAIRASNPKSRVEISALLSNAAACRLQLLKSSTIPEAAAIESSEVTGGRRNEDVGTTGQSPAMMDEEGDSERSAHARAAVEEARRCVRLNPTWSRGYLRLAEALIASKGHSNDVSNEACNCLQTALRLDPNLNQARRLLQQELSRDHDRPIRRRVRFASPDFSEAHPERSVTDRTNAEDANEADSVSPAAGAAETTYELHDASGSSRTDRFRSTWVRARRKATGWFWRHSDRLCQLGMLLALVLFLGELVLLLDELAVQTPAFRGRAGSRPSNFAKRLGPINVVRQYRLASTTFQGNYWPSHIYQHYQQALTFDKYREAYEEFRKRSQLRPVDPPPHDSPRAAYLYGAFADPDLPLPSSRSALPLARIKSSEAKLGLACWVLLLPLVVMSILRMRRHVVESVALPAQHARRLARHYGAVLGRRGRTGPSRAVPIEH